MTLLVLFNAPTNEKSRGSAGITDPREQNCTTTITSYLTGSGSSTSISSQPVIIALKWDKTVSPVVAR